MSAANILQAITLINDLLILTANAGRALETAATTIRQAQNEGRDITDAEFALLRSKTTRIKDALDAEIQRRESGG